LGTFSDQPVGGDRVLRRATACGPCGQGGEQPVEVSRTGRVSAIS
jgi:hypothetical protein